MLSLWEKNWFFNSDTIIVGSGIVGLSTAAAILEAQPSHQVLILERGLIPAGASTRNGGFASIGSYFEVQKDLALLGEKGCFNKVKIMYESISKLRKRVGDANLDFRQDGGYDIFTEEMLPKLKDLKRVNDLVRPIFNEDAFYLATEKIEEFGLNKDIVKALVFNKYEGQIDSGKGILNFQKYVTKLGARIITGAEVISYKKDDHKDVIVDVKDPFGKEGIRQFRSQNLVFCIDTYSLPFVKDMGLDFHPVRGQVVVTSPIKDLKLKGSFLYHDGYFYARDYHGRLLIGGGAYLFWDEEMTYEVKTTEKVMAKIKALLKEVLLPGKEFTIEHEWAGLMCYGKSSEEPIITKIEDNVYAALRLAGEGVARASHVAENVKDMVLKSHQVKPKL